MASTSLPGATDKRLASLVTLLTNNATIAISGARIAREIGVSRSTVWRWIEQLREVGVRVKGRPHTGYFLERVPDILTPELLRARLKSSLFAKRIYHFFRTDSTNRVGMELGYAGEPEGTVILAEEQSFALSMFSFSLGLESGQILVVLLVLLLCQFFVRLLKVDRRQWVIFVSAAVFALSLEMAIHRWPWREKSEEGTAAEASRIEIIPELPSSFYA